MKTIMKNVLNKIQFFNKKNKPMGKESNQKREEVISKLFGYSFSIEFNLNDAFYWGCSDSCSICRFDLTAMMSLIELYEYDAILAYESIRRNHPPQRVNKKFYLARKGIFELLEQGKLYDLRDFLAENDFTTKGEKSE